MNTDVQKIKERVDIVELVQEYVQLKQFGTNWKGLCPFHHEKSPSFMVSRDKQIWHCFGCDRGGDAFSFVQEMDGMEFAEALRILAKRAGVELSNNYSPKNASRKQLLLEIVAQAQEYYSTLLHTSTTASAMRDYVVKRGISKETSKDFGIGASLDSWDGLYNFLRGKQFKDDAIAEAGLIIKRSNGQGYYDRFRNRLMIPLQDYNGTVVGFTARTLDPEAPGGKYINSPQSPIYDKSAILYGLYFSKNAIKRLKSTIVVEGNIDVITAHQEGFPNVVATSGTAFTDQQIKLLKRYSPNLLLAFDMDEAGIQAAQRSITVALRHDMNVKVIQLPAEYKDPDECIRQNPEAFKQAIREAMHIIDFYFKSTIDPLDMTRVEHKKKAVQQLLPIVRSIGSPVERSHYVQRLSDMTRTPLDIIKQQLKSLPAAAQQAQPSRDTNRNSTAIADTSKQENTEMRGVPDRYTKLSQFVVGMAFVYPDQVPYIIESLEEGFLTTPAMKQLYKQVQSYYNKARQFDVTKFRAEYPQNGSEIDTLELFVQSQLAGPTTGEPSVQSGTDMAEQGRVQLIQAIQQLHKFYIQHRLQNIEFELKEAERHNQQETVNSLVQELTTITEQLRELSS